MDKFRGPGVPIRQTMSLRLEPKFKFLIGAKNGDDLGLRLVRSVGTRWGRIHILR